MPPARKTVCAIYIHKPVLTQCTVNLAHPDCVIDFRNTMETSARMIATRESWLNHPLPEQRGTLCFQREFTQEEYELIRIGLIPEWMEHKWFIFLEDDVLYFHRSWTGHCIYQLRLRKDGANYTVAEALVNRDVIQYKWTDDSYDEKLLTFLIDNLLLGKSSTFPVPAGVPPGIATGLYHHSIAGVGPRARETPVTITVRGALGWLWAWLKFLIRR